MAGMYVDDTISVIAIIAAITLDITTVLLVFMSSVLLSGFTRTIIFERVVHYGSPTVHWFAARAQRLEHA